MRPTAKGPWCNQHHRQRSACLPGDRHVQSFRGSDELVAAVAAKAAQMGLSRQDGFEMALEEFVGWRTPGTPWKGPAQWTGAERAASVTASIRSLGARMRQQRSGEPASPAPASPAPAVFMEPGGKPVVAAVPERKGRR